MVFSFTLVLTVVRPLPIDYRFIAIVVTMSHSVDKLSVVNGNDMGLYKYKFYVNLYTIYYLRHR